MTLGFVPHFFPFKRTPRIEKSALGHRPYSLSGRKIAPVALFSQQETTHITVDVSVLGLDEKVETLAKTLEQDGRALVSKALHKQPAELSLVLCSDTEILKLNTSWRGKEKPTDVLSFPQDDDVVLGDIVISVDTAARQAAERALTLEDEVRVLLVHGLLHLMGYDHEQSESALQEMANAEQRLMSEMGWPGEGLISSMKQRSSGDGIHDTVST